MVKHALRSLIAHKVRFLLTVAAVTIGVAFVAGTFVLSDTMGKAFDQLYAGLTKGVDVTVKAKAAYTDLSTQGQTRPLDERLVQDVAAVPGVSAAQGGVTGYALVLDKFGKPIQPGGAPTLGSSIGADRRLAGDFSFRAGRAPSGDREVVLDAGTARKAGYHVGDTARVVFQDGTRSFTVVGTVGFGQTDSLAGATLAGFDLPTAQHLLGKVGKVDGIDVLGDGTLTPEQLRAAVEARLPAEVQAQTGSEAASESSKAVRDGLGIFTKVLLVFAAVSLLVGSFVIWNTFNVIVAQRRRETALMRAVGATRAQVLTGIVLEALIVGMVSSLLGLLAGVGLAVGIRALLSAIGIDVPTTSAAVEPRTVLVALIVGVVVTLVAAVVPALAATRVAPVEALREAQAVGGGIGRRRTVIGTVSLALGLGGLAFCIASGGQPQLTALSALLAFAGLVIAGPLLARGVATLADRGRRGSGWRLAARNVGRSPQRAAATALALTIGLTVVTAVTVTAASTKASVADIVNEGNRSDLILKAAGQGAGFSPAVADVLRQRDDVKTVVQMRWTGAKVHDASAAVAALDTAGIEDVAELGLQQGGLSDFRDGTMLVSSKEATKLGVTSGAKITVQFPETGTHTFRVAGIFEHDSLIGTGYVIPLTDFARNVTSTLDEAVLVRDAPGADPAAVQAGIEKALATDYPNVQVQNGSQLTEESQKSIDQLLGMVTALLLLAVIVAILGIVNTLVLSVVERTRELGLMRAVGATRRQVRTVVRRESILMSLLGAVTGIALGTVTGVALSRAMVENGIRTISVPVPTLVVYIVVAAAVGALAAIGPARRASRVDVLKAVTVE
ncbi:ABC transporter permease [Terrabacter sp. BE26]|uniref:ABC transporter permease n=1 Tax=Terrabacter sp. BE26 TaxID=2898152 RepID=UPI0035BE7554